MDGNSWEALVEETLRCTLVRGAISRSQSRAGVDLGVRKRPGEWEIWVLLPEDASDWVL